MINPLIPLILQLGKLRPKEIKVTCPGSHGKFSERAKTWIHVTWIQVVFFLQDQKAHGFFLSFTIWVSEFTFWPDVGSTVILWAGVTVAFPKGEFPGKHIAYVAEQCIEILLCTHVCVFIPLCPSQMHTFHFNTRQVAEGSLSFV